VFFYSLLLGLIYTVSRFFAHYKGNFEGYLGLINTNVFALTVGANLLILYAGAGLFNIMSEGNMTAIKMFGMPFIVESILILYLTIQKVVVPKIENRQSEIIRVDKENDLSESLLGRSEKKAIKIHSSFLGRAEQWFYELFDINFMPQFCNLSFKQGLLNKCSEKHGSQQTAILGLIFLEIYFSLMSVVTT
jgi:hypothetical protein